MTAKPRIGHGLARTAQAYLIVAFPALLVLIAARLVMTPLFLQFEYNRPGFPDDPFGFTREDRFAYAPYAIDYLLNGEGIEYLGDLKFPNGASLYNADELRHMRDVKALTQIAFALATGGGLVAVGAMIYLRRRARGELNRARFFGSTLTLGIVAAIVILALVDWEYFFVGFHQLFFAGGTWYFPTSDTLIRLFPEQFWFDAALTIGGLTVGTALIVCFVTWRALRSKAL
ncbi:MAG: TIGR01906 family membrane protein [Anaerolineae bacterium]|nr:TIGR01906 family membrane protein [Anaerolineae bacterium]